MIGSISKRYWAYWAGGLCVPIAFGLITLLIDLLSLLPGLGMLSSASGLFLLFFTHPAALTIPFAVCATAIMLARCSLLEKFAIVIITVLLLAFEFVGIQYACLYLGK